MDVVCVWNNPWMSCVSGTIHGCPVCLEQSMDVLCVWMVKHTPYTRVYEHSYTCMHAGALHDVQSVWK